VNGCPKGHIPSNRLEIARKKEPPSLAGNHKDHRGGGRGVMSQKVLGFLVGKGRKAAQHPSLTFSPEERDNSAKEGLGREGR